MTIASLIDEAATMFCSSRAEILGDCRAQGISRARFAVAWAARKGLGLSTSVIGRALGGRDHTTIIHAIRRAEQLRADNDAFRRSSDALLAVVA